METSVSSNFTFLLRLIFALILIATSQQHPRGNEINDESTSVIACDISDSGTVSGISEVGILTLLEDKDFKVHLSSVTDCENANAADWRISF